MPANKRQYNAIISLLPIASAAAAAAAVTAIALSLLWLRIMTTVLMMMI